MRHIRYLLLLLVFMGKFCSTSAETTLDATNGWTKNDVEAFTVLLKERLSMINQEGNPQLVYSNKVIEEAARKFGGKGVVIWYEQMRLKAPLSFEEQELKKLVETAAYYLLNQSIFDLPTQFLGIKTGWFERGRTKEYQESLIMQQQRASQLLSHLFYYEMAVQRKAITKNEQGKDVDTAAMVTVAPFRELLTHLALLMVAVNDKPMSNNERDAAIALIINKVFFQIRTIEQQVTSGLLDEIGELSQLLQLYLPKRTIPWGNFAKFLIVAGATTAVVTLVAGAIMSYYSSRVVRAFNAQMAAGQAAIQANVAAARGAAAAQLTAFVAGFDANHQAVVGQPAGAAAGGGVELVAPEVAGGAVGANPPVVNVAVGAPAPQAVAAGVGPMVHGAVAHAGAANPPVVAVEPVPLATQLGALVAGAAHAMLHMRDEGPAAREVRLRAIATALGVPPASFNASVFGLVLRNPVAANAILRLVAVSGRGLAPLLRSVAVPLDFLGAGDQANLARNFGDMATGIAGAAAAAENMFNTRNHQLVNRFHRHFVLPTAAGALVVGGTTAVAYLLPPVVPIVANSLAAAVGASAVAVEIFPQEAAEVPRELHNLSPLITGICLFPTQGLLPVAMGAAGSLAYEYHRPSRLSVLCRRPARPALAAAAAAAVPVAAVGAAGGPVPAVAVAVAPVAVQGWRIPGWVRALLGRCSVRR